MIGRSYSDFKEYHTALKAIRKGEFFDMMDIAEKW